MQTVTPFSWAQSLQPGAQMDTTKMMEVPPATELGRWYGQTLNALDYGLRGASDCIVFLSETIL